MLGKLRQFLLPGFSLKNEPVSSEATHKRREVDISQNIAIYEEYLHPKIERPARRVIGSKNS